MAAMGLHFDFSDAKPANMKQVSLFHVGFAF
jgi:hypothetical protein